MYSKINLEMLQEIEPALGGSSNTGVWIFLIIFFGIILALIIVAVIGSRKDKNEKLIENNKRKKIRNAADRNRVIIYISLEKSINKLNKELVDFTPSIGVRSLGDINKEYSDMLKSIKNSENFKDVCLSEDYSNEMKPIIDELSSVKPSSWAKEADFSLNLIFAKTKALKNSDDNKEDIELGKNKKWN